MASGETASRSMRRYLLWWICGSGAVLVLCYTVLLELYLDVGVRLRAANDLERVAADYAVRRAADPTAPLPAAPHIAAYRRYRDMPDAVRGLFPADEYRPGGTALAYPEGAGWVSRALGGILPACREETPCEALFLHSHRLDGGEWLYLLQGLAVGPAQDAEQDGVENAARALGAFLVLALALLTFALVDRTRRPVEALARWADGLDPEGLRSPPDFRFRELDTVAARLRDAFARLSEGMAEEQRFLRHASHELRAPLAVVSGNLEILERIGGPEGRDGPRGEALARLGAAVIDMRQLTETLLWLHRPSDRPLERESVDLDALVRRLVEENRYLLDGKPVEVEVGGDASRIEAPAVPCRIVVANLVRNAFQYTHAGRIGIRVGAGEVTVRNANDAQAGGPATGSAGDYGFGLGLELVERICARLGWTCACAPAAAGRSTTVRFGP